MPVESTGGDNRLEHASPTSASELRSTASVMVLGGVSTRIDGRVRRLTPSRRQLLALLVAAGPNGLSADHLADELWSGTPPNQWDSSLRMAVSRLRRDLPTDALPAGDGRYRLDLPAHEVDLWLLQALAEDQTARDALGRAVGLSQLLVASRNASPVTPQDREIGRWRRTAWVTAAVAGCLAFLLALQIVWEIDPQRSPIATGKGIAETDASSPELASAWVEMVDALTESLVAADWELLRRDEEEFEQGLSDVGESLGVEASDSQSVVAPDWMMVAVSGLHSGT